ncbi:GntR family transcriptional regulator [Paenibacillus thalictri]|uniref:GntR family transcriptional regulator n=1 Tax=Paenibacillus thalictri TaxID=2527873 RepID=A0A4Q9DR13_9BACL|nr:GntR family transcriptional regulator [Paenibacillus thalictri]TBL77852.1 GntR family transcriptional regulator [Paenibacillus thalictri]
MSQHKAVPKYLQLKQEILGWFEVGQLKEGDQMPTEHEIAERFQMSRQTVRQTFGELEREGWLQRMQGRGTFVSRPGVSGYAGQNQEIRTIGVVTTYISDYIFPHIVRGAEAALRGRGYRMLLSSTDNDKLKERENLEMMLGQPLSGIMIEPTRSAEGNPNLDLYLSLDYKNIPYIMINERYTELNCPVIKVDDEAGAYKAAAHLIELGHRHIAGFFKMDDLQGVNRLKGFLRAHHERKVPLLPDSVVHYTTGEKETRPYEAALRLLQQETGARPSAFVCYNDELAVKLLEAARQLGLSVPEQLSVVGFDDSSLATATEVKLTTLTHPKAELGRLAAEWLMDMIEGKQPAQASYMYEPELIVRDSTRAV